MPEYDTISGPVLMEKGDEEVSTYFVAHFSEERISLWPRLNCRVLQRCHFADDDMMMSILLASQPACLIRAILLPGR